MIEPGPRALDASTLPVRYRGGKMTIFKACISICIVLFSEIHFASNSQSVTIPISQNIKFYRQQNSIEQDQISFSLIINFFKATLTKVNKLTDIVRWVQSHIEWY